MDAKKIKSAIEKNRNQAVKQLEEIRLQINQVDDELHWIENSPLTLEDAKKNIDQFLDRYAHNDGVEHFFYTQGQTGLNFFETNVNLDREATRIISDSSQIIGSGVASIARVLIPLFGETLRRQLHDLAQKESLAIESGPPLAERPELTKKLEQQRLELEIAEEALICSAEELGMDGFYRRHDCNPEVVLMMEA